MALDLDFYVHLTFLQLEKCCGRAIVRSSDNSSFSGFCCCLLTSKISFRKTIRGSNSLDPDQDYQKPDLGPNCLQR